MKAKLLLAIAIVLEVTGTLFMKQSTISNNQLDLLLTLLLVGTSYILFSQAIKTIPLGIAYALWEGFGLTAITALSILLFSENISLAKALGLVILMLGIHFVSHGSKAKPKPEQQAGDWSTHVA